MMITPIQLKTVFPKCHDPNAWCRIFTMELGNFEINTPLRVAAWVAQCGYESSSFNQLRESGSYTAKRLMEVWPARFPTLEAARPYEYNPEGLLNMIYANVDGNGPPESRDGLKYRGGGLIQLTGRYNYRVVGQALKLPLESLPKMIEQPAIAARAAGYFWQQHNLNEAADAGDFAAITKHINPAMEGLVDRTAYYVKALELLKAPAPKRGPLPGPGPQQIVKPSPGIAPGPVPLGTQDGLHTPGNQFNLEAQRIGQGVDAARAAIAASKAAVGG